LILNIPGGIQVILFDLDGTLRHNLPSSTHAFLDYAVRLGASNAPESRRQAERWTHYYWAQSPELLADMAFYGDRQDQFWLNYARRNLLAFDCPEALAAALAPEVHRYMSEEFMPADWVPPDVPGTLQRLKEAGYRLGVLSNRDDPVHDYLGELSLVSCFDLVLVAGEVGSWKPEPEIFLLAVERLGVSPAQTLYVGDNYYADFIGAQRAGLHPVLVDPEGLFPEADCAIIKNVGELLDLVRRIP
jgi:HAD superfamily hydrolase (TIGR01509 family)